jgi:hypothetical protein
LAEPEPGRSARRRTIEPMSTERPLTRTARCTIGSRQTEGSALALSRTESVRRAMSSLAELAAASPVLSGSGSGMATQR